MPDTPMVGHSSIKQVTQQAASLSRFAFGRNWREFLGSIDENRIKDAEISLCQMLDVQTLSGLRFLDIGSGSGLFSLAARRLGARVHSIDCDPDSVFCTQQLHEIHRKDDYEWTVDQEDVLDREAIGALGKFDIVYAWGVLHHTGAMWQAIANAAAVVAANGHLFIALYNDQGWLSTYWFTVKRVFNMGFLGRTLMIALHAPYLFGLRWLFRAARHRGRLPRGMLLWRDMIDWLGGLPFEVARPDVVIARLEHDGFIVKRIVTCGRHHGCNEYVFQRNGAGTAHTGDTVNPPKYS